MQDSKTKVMIVDDSSVIRKIVGETVGSDPNLEVVDKASNGKIALDKIKISKPDVIILDIEMPEMNGFETLKELRKTDKQTKVIMFSSMSRSSAEITLEALSLGANDFVVKPGDASNIEDLYAKLRKELIPRIYSICRITSKTEEKVYHRILPYPGAGSNRVDIVVVGVSTGGPAALEQVIPLLPANLQVPVVIVQHMPPIFTKSLAVRLDSLSTLGVVEATDGQEISPGNVYIAPGGKHIILKRLDLTRTIIRTNDDPPENSCRPAVDVLFRSAASVYGKHTLAVVMTGMGYDGTKGGKNIVDSGGQLIIQDKESSVVWGMPGSVADAGLAHGIFPLDRIAREICERVSKQRN